MTAQKPRELKPCPFCGGEAELSLDGTQPEVSCQDCGMNYSVQISDHFSHDERYNNPDFKWIDAPEYNYGVGGLARAKKVLTEFWNTRADLATTQPANADVVFKVGEKGGVVKLKNSDGSISSVIEIDKVYGNTDAYREQQPTGDMAKALEELNKALAHRDTDHISPCSLMLINRLLTATAQPDDAEVRAKKAEKALSEFNRMIGAEIGDYDNSWMTEQSIRFVRQTLIRAATANKAGV